MPWYQKIGIGLSLGLIILLAAAWWISTSAWFMWGVLSENPFRVFLDLSGPNRNLVTSLVSHYPAIAEKIPFDATTIRRVLYAPGEQIVALPRLGRGTDLIRQLKQAGWQPRRMGLLVVAAQGNNGTSSLPETTSMIRSGIRNVVEKRIFSYQPLHPVFIAVIAPERVSSLQIPFLRVIGTRRGNSLHLSLVTEDIDSWPSREKDQLPETRPLGLVASLPGSALKLLPPDQKRAWNEQLRAKLGLIHTKPDIIEDLSALPQVNLNLEKDLIALGQWGTDEKFGQLLQAWFGQELALQKPVSKAFLLPDRTLGYEKYPGEAPQVFSQIPNTGECQKSLVWTTPLSLCRNDHELFVTNQAEMAPIPTSANDSAWSLLLGKDLTSRLSNLPLETIHAWGSGKEAHMTIRLTP